MISTKKIARFFFVTFIVKLTPAGLRARFRPSRMSGNRGQGSFVCPKQPRHILSPTEETRSLLSGSNRLGQNSNFFRIGRLESSFGFLLIFAVGTGLPALLS